MSKSVTNLVVWLPQEAFQDNLPETFIKNGNDKCRAILDCGEVLLKDQNHRVVKLQPGLIVNTITL